MKDATTCRLTRMEGMRAQTHLSKYNGVVTTRRARIRMDASLHSTCIGSLLRGAAVHTLPAFLLSELIFASPDVSDFAHQKMHTGRAFGHRWSSPLNEDG